MKKLLLIFFITPILLFAQKEQDSTLGKWIPKGVAGINISQIAFSNWTQGGDNSITYSLVGNFGLNHKTESWTFTNSLKIAYGQTKLGDENFKTNDNEIYLESVLSHKLGWAVDPFFSNTVRTAVAPGYQYDGNTKVEIANIFDPGYITQSIGFTYDKMESFKSRIGLAFQETFANEYTGYTDDPDTEDEIESFKFETGIESVTDAEFTLDDNMLLKSKLRLFSAFDRMDTWDVRWDNAITAQVNKYINVNLTVLVIYEKSQSIETQIKQALQLGFTYNIF